MLYAQNPNDATYPKQTNKNLLALINSVEDAKLTCQPGGQSGNGQK